MSKLERLLFLTIVLSMLLMLQPVTQVRAQEEYPREKTLVIAFPHPKNPNWDLFNPFIPVWWAYDIGSCQFMYEYLAYGLLSNGTIVPWLATGWEFVDEEYKEFRIHLREGVHWSDGVPFTADDIVFTVKDILLKYGPQVSGGSWALEWIEDAIKEDDYTVLIKWKKPNPRAWMWITTGIIAAQWFAPKHIFETVEDITEFKFSDPIGTGPYKLKYKSDELYIWEKDPNWWAREVLGYEQIPDYIVFKYYPSKEARMMALLNGEVDVIRGLTGPEIEMLKTTFPNLVVWSLEKPYYFPDPCPRTLYVNCQKYPFNNPKVRKAISLFIDKLAVQEVAEPGAGAGAKYAWATYPGLMKYVFDDIVEEYGSYVEYNPEKGHQILEELGWHRDADGVYVTENGTRMEGLIIYGGADPASAIQLQLAENGIMCTVKPTIHDPAFFATWRAGLWDILVGWECGSSLDPLATYMNFHAKHIINWTLYKETGQIEWIAPIGVPTDSHHHNSMRWLNLTFSELVDQLAMVPSDSPEGIEILRQLQIIITQEQPTIPVWQGGSNVVMSNLYWTNWPNKDNPYTGPDIHWGYAKFWVVARPDSPYGIRPAEVVTPPPVTYVTVYAKTDIEEFVGADGKTYGPFSAGDTMVIPKEDADRLLAEGLASRTPPVPPELEAIAASVTEVLSELDALETSLLDELSAIEENTAGLSESIEALSGQIGAMASTAMTAMALNVIVIVLVIVNIALTLRKK